MDYSNLVRAIQKDMERQTEECVDDYVKEFQAKIFRRAMVIAAKIIAIIAVVLYFILGG